METTPSMDIGLALAFIEKIDLVLAKQLLGPNLSADILRELDTPDVGKQALDTIGLKLGEELCLKLTAIANSIYLGTLRRGNVDSFYEVVNCLGTEKTKALIIMLTRHMDGRVDPDMEAIFARSYATSIMAMILAGQTGLREDVIKRAELCGLYLEIGRKFMILYKKMFPKESDPLTDGFIALYHPYLGEKIVRRYGLPEYVRQVILARNVLLEENHISLAGIVYIAHDTVRNSFQKFHNRLVLKCEVPRPGTDVTRTLEAIITEKFRALGLEKYLHIIKVPKLYDL